MTEPVVVDASIVAMWSLPDPRAGLAEALAHHWLANEILMLAPPLLPPEVNTAAYQHVRRSLLTLAEAHGAVRTALAVGIRIVDHPRLQEQALELAARFRLRASYNAQYLALAQLHGCPLWTADERLYNSVRTALPSVRWLGDSATVDALLGPGGSP